MAKFKQDDDDFFSSDVAPSTGRSYEDREIDGWYEPVEGVIVAGIILEYLTINDEDDGPRECCIIELKRPVTAKMNEKPIELEPGHVLAVGFRAKLAPLFKYDAGAKAWFVPTGRKKLSGKRQPMWQFKTVCDGPFRPLGTTPVAF